MSISRRRARTGWGRAARVLAVGALIGGMVAVVPAATVQAAAPPSNPGWLVSFHGQGSTAAADNNLSSFDANGRSVNKAVLPVGSQDPALNELRGMVLTSNGSLLVANATATASAILQYGPGTSPRSPLPLIGSGVLAQGAPAIAGISHPYGLVQTTTGTVLVSSQDTAVVTQLTATGAVGPTGSAWKSAPDVLAGTLVPSTTSVPAGQGGLTSPRGLVVVPATTGDATLYVADNGAESVRSYDAVTGAFLADVLTKKDGLDGAPVGIIAHDGLLYISTEDTSSDEVSHVIEFDPASAKSREVVPQDIEDKKSGEKKVSLDHASGLAFGPDGRLYVASRVGRQVNAYTLDGSDHHVTLASVFIKKLADEPEQILPVGLSAGFDPLVAGVDTASALPSGSGYVAMGDSYSAGYGILPSTNVPAPGCQQSVEDYPHQVAAALGLQLTDVTCTGAVTANIDQTPQQTEFVDGSAGGTAPLQDSVLSAQTKLVTLTIGGNDLKFAPIAQACFALSAQGPVAGLTPPLFAQTNSECQSIIEADPAYAPSTLLPVVTKSIARVLADIKQKAPNAKIFVLEYPAIAPSAANTPAAGCFTPALTIQLPNVTPVPDAFPFTPSDTTWLHTVQAGLNGAIDVQAAAAGAVLVPAFAQSDPHSACADATTQWVNGITLTQISLSPPSVTQATGNLHPNVAGVAFLTRQVLAAVAQAFPTPPPTTATTTSTVRTTATVTHSTATTTSTTVSTSKVIPPTTTTTAPPAPPLPDTGPHGVGNTLVAGLALLALGTGALLVARRRDRRPDGQHR